MTHLTRRRVAAPRGRLLSLLLGLFVGLVAATGGLPLLAAPAQAADTGCYVNALLVNSCRPWLGASANNYPEVTNNKQAQLQYHESRIGRQLDVVHTYHSAADNALSAVDLAFANRPDTMLFTNWRVTETWADGGGANEAVNARIDSMAASIKALGSTKIFLALSHEPENHLSSDPNCANLAFVGTSGSPEEYKAMWANVRRRFDAAGVTNVVWVMNYMNYAPWNCVVQDVYPGDNLVDWIVFNGYQTGDTNVSFSAKVHNLYDLLTVNSSPAHDYLSKPWGIVEWGIRTSTQASAVQYYGQAQAAVENGSLPKLKLYMVFDQTATGSTDGSLRVGYDKAGNPDATEQAAYTRFATSPSLTGASTNIGGDRTPPTVTLDAPGDGSSVGGRVTVSGSAADDVALADTTLLVDGQPAGTATGASPAVAWDSSTVPDGPHTLALRARDRAGNTADSTPVSVSVTNVVPDTTPPSAPGSVSVTLATPTSARVSWTPATDDTAVTGYQVLRDGVAVATLDGTATGYTDTGLDQARSYAYTVTASDGVGHVGPAGGPATVTTSDTTAPTPPTALAAASGPRQVSLSWAAATDNVGVAGYRVYRNGALVGSPTGTAYVDTGLTDLTTYSYTVAAVDAAGNPSSTAAASARTPDATPPSAPGTLTASVSGTTVTLTWRAATDTGGVSTYTVLRNGVAVATTASLTYRDTTAAQGVTSTYTITATDAAGNVGPAGNSATARVPDRTAPSAPPSLVAVGGSRRVTLTWGAATDNVAVAGYYLYRGTTRIASPGSTVRGYTDANLTSNRTYSYRLIAVDTSGNQGTASTASARAS